MAEIFIPTIAAFMVAVYWLARERAELKQRVKELTREAELNRTFWG